jgi:hypothetical protein
VPTSRQIHRHAAPIWRRGAPPIGVQARWRRARASRNRHDACTVREGRRLAVTDDPTDLRPRSTATGRIFLTAGVALLALSGCATIQRAEAKQKERVLAAAGFQMKLADTPDRFLQIESLPQRKLTRVSDEGELRFVYADKDYCKCLYAGTEAAYDRYQKLSLEKEIADERRTASSNWGAWGYWGPWY